MHHRRGEFEDGMETGTVSAVVVTLFAVAVFLGLAFKFHILQWGVAT